MTAGLLRNGLNLEMILRRRLILTLSQLKVFTLIQTERELGEIYLFMGITQKIISLKESGIRLQRNAN
jgi:hypothetical protein